MEHMYVSKGTASLFFRSDTKANMFVWPFLIFAVLRKMFPPPSVPNRSGEFKTGSRFGGQKRAQRWICSTLLSVLPNLISAFWWRKNTRWGREEIGRYWWALVEYYTGPLVSILHTLLRVFCGLGVCWRYAVIPTQNYKLQEVLGHNPIYLLIQGSKCPGPVDRPNSQ